MYMEHDWETMSTDRINMLMRMIEARDDMRTAAETGDIQRLRELRDDGIEWDEEITAIAARANQLVTLQWLLGYRPNGNGEMICDPTVDACIVSHNILAEAVIDCPDVWNWLLSQGHQLSSACYREAARAHRIDILERLLEQKCPWDDTVPGEAFDDYDDNPAPHAAINTFRWLLEHGCPFTGSESAQVSGDDSAVVQVLDCMYDAGWVPEPVACENMIGWFSPAGLRHLVARGCPWDPDECLREAERWRGSDRRELIELIESLRP